MRCLGYVFCGNLFYELVAPCFLVSVLRVLGILWVPKLETPKKLQKKSFLRSCALARLNYGRREFLSCRRLVRTGHSIVVGLEQLTLVGLFPHLSVGARTTAGMGHRLRAAEQNLEFFTGRTGKNQAFKLLTLLKICEIAS